MAATTYRFGNTRVDTTGMRLYVNDSVVEIEPKAFRLLLLLLERAGEALSKDEIFQIVWPDVAVSDSALTRVVAQLRKALGDDPREPRFIETVPTIGYRFVGKFEPPELPSPVRRRAWVVVLACTLAALGGVVLYAISVARPGASDPKQYTPPHQLTNGLTLETDGSFSPDGGAVVYASDRGPDGQFELYVRQLRKDAREIAVTSGSGGAIQPVWSPDGAQIAFHCLAHGGICTVPALGGPIRVLTRYGSRPAWSPDSSMIAFQTAPMQSMHTDDVIPYFHSGIQVIRLNGTGPVAVTSPPVRERHLMPVWAPSGPPRILFVAQVEGAASIRSVDPETKSSQVLVMGSFLYPAVTGEGLYALRPQVRWKGDERLGPDLVRWQVNWATQTVQDAGNPSLVLTENRPIGSLAATQDGRRILIGLRTANTSNLYRIGLNPSTEPVPVTANASERNSLPSISPEGDQVAFTQKEQGRRLPGVWRVPLDGTGSPPTLVSLGIEGDFSPRWIGKEVAYSSYRAGKWTLLVTSPESRQERILVTLNRHGNGGSVSPDGRFVASDRIENGELKVVIRDLRTGGERLLPGEGAFPVWNANGDVIGESFSKADGSNQVVYWPAAEPDRRYQLTRGPGLSWPWTDSPDHTRVAYAGQRHGVWNLYATRLRSEESAGDEQKLTSVRSPRFFVRYPAWSPRGDSIVFEMAESRGNLFVAELIRP
jgi:Tol biopolymer transport system component/DNA-binding winged helix-turn-helix (wHTH) protein